MDNRVSIREFTNEIIEEHGDKANAALVIVVDDESAHSHIVGISPNAMDDNAVHLAICLSQLLHNKFSFANVVAEHLKAVGSLDFNYKDLGVREDDEPEPKKPSKKKSPDFDDCDVALLKLLAAIVKGGHDDEDDD